MIRAGCRNGLAALPVGEEADENCRATGAIPIEPWKDGSQRPIGKGDANHEPFGSVQASM